MITTKNNFRSYLRKHYPNINAYPIFGTPAYVLDKQMSDLDNYIYNLQSLPNGKFVVFIGVTIEEATNLFNKLKSGNIPKSSHERNNPTAPTTFSCFEAWLDRNDYKYMNRTFCSNMTPEECFRTENIESCAAPRKKGTWYMYELPGYIDDGKRFENIPHVTLDYGERGDVIIVLIKASASVYKSKKQRFLEKFQLMQPLYEQIIVACATGDWEHAQLLCIQYMNIQFDIEGTIDIEKIKEAYCNGTIGLFLRDPKNMSKEDVDTL